MSADEHRERITEAVAAHQAVATGLGEWACKCSPHRWRPSAHRSRHVADALLPIVAQIEAEARAKAVIEHNATLAWHGAQS